MTTASLLVGWFVAGLLLLGFIVWNRRRTNTPGAQTAATENERRFMNVVDTARRKMAEAGKQGPDAWAAAVAEAELEVGYSTQTVPPSSQGFSAAERDRLLAWPSIEH